MSIKHSRKDLILNVRFDSRFYVIKVKFNNTFKIELNLKHNECIKLSLKVKTFPIADISLFTQTLKTLP